MWIYVCPNQWTNNNSKNGRKGCFSYETKAWISFIPIRRIRLWCLITKKKRLLCDSVFVKIDQRTLILKMVEREVFLMTPEDEYHLSQQGEWICGAQSSKEGDYYVNLCLSNWKMNFNP